MELRTLDAASGPQTKSRPDFAQSERAPRELRQGGAREQGYPPYWAGGPRGYRSALSSGRSPCSSYILAPERRNDDFPVAHGRGLGRRILLLRPADRGGPRGGGKRAVGRRRP